MIVGRSTKGTVPIVLLADQKYVARTEFDAVGALPKLTVYLDGKGGGLGDQVARAVVYDAKTDLLLGQSAEVVVKHSQKLGWVDFPFSETPGGCLIPAPGLYDIGLHAGSVSSVIRVYA